MRVVIGTESSGSDPNLHQILEMVVITTTDEFSLLNVSPTYVLHRPPGGPIEDARYRQYIKNKLLDECSTAHRKPFHVEGMLLERFGRHNKNMLNAVVVYRSLGDKLMVGKCMPEFVSSIGRKELCYDDLMAEQTLHNFNKYADPGRALETALIMISNIKLLCKTSNYVVGC